MLLTYKEKCSIAGSTSEQKTRQLWFKGLMTSHTRLFTTGIKKDKIRQFLIFNGTKKGKLQVFVWSQDRVNNALLHYNVIAQCCEHTFMVSVMDFGRNRLKPTSFSKYSKLDFLSKATCGISLKKRLKQIYTGDKAITLQWTTSNISLLAYYSNQLSFITNDVLWKIIWYICMQTNLLYTDYTN